MPTTKRVEIHPRKIREKKVKIYAIRGVDSSGLVLTDSSYSYYYYYVAAV